jgi:hypothetical protein
MTGYLTAALAIVAGAVVFYREQCKADDRSNPVLTWHCTKYLRHLPHTWFYRRDRTWYRCDGQEVKAALTSSDAVSLESINEGNNPCT